jgi:hypothetical protein
LNSKNPWQTKAIKRSSKQKSKATKTSKASERSKRKKKKPKGFQKQNSLGAIGAHKRRKQVLFDKRHIQDDAERSWYEHLHEWTQQVRICLTLGRKPPAPSFGNFPGGYAASSITVKKETDQ